ncbi:MAG: hypothetical protein IIW92_05110 [Lachnospiraceae bacterium]|nr:hypothetical protein [Lachnospiraceae bacterium]
MSNTRNLADVGPNLQKIVKRLQSNQKLLKLLYYTDKDPYEHDDLTDIQIREEIFEKLIKIIPRVGPKETAHSMIVLRLVNGRSNPGNNEFRDFRFDIEVFVPLTQWIIKDSNLRPYAIMGEIHESLNGKTVEGLGRISGGDFQINFLTEEMSAYEMNYYITSYD